MVSKITVFLLPILLPHFSGPINVQQPEKFECSPTMEFLNFLKAIKENDQSSLLASSSQNILLVDYRNGIKRYQDAKTILQHLSSTILAYNNAEPDYCAQAILLSKGALGERENVTINLIFDNGNKISVFRIYPGPSPVQSSTATVGYPSSAIPPPTSIGNPTTTKPTTTTPYVKDTKKTTAGDPKNPSPGSSIGSPNQAIE